MGVSLQVWRQRIGVFHSRSPRKCKEHVEVSSTLSPSSFTFGVGSCTFITILLSVGVCTFINDLTVCGDVEANPGPPAPQLSDTILVSLKNGTCASVGEFANKLKNKHILQIITIKGEKKQSTWPEVVDWMKYFYPNTNFDDKKKWSRSFCDNFTKIKGIYQKKNKSYKKDDQTRQEMDEWLETEYNLPCHTTVKPSAHATASSPSLFQCQVNKSQIDKLEKSTEKLQQENKELKEQVHALKDRPSPHTQKLAERRESEHWEKIYFERECVQVLEKKTEQLQNKVGATKTVKRNLSSDYKKASKIIKQSHEEDIESYKAEVENLKRENTKLREKLLKITEHNNELMEEIEHLTEVSHDAKIKTISMYDTEKRSYFPFVHKCIWNLISKHVSFANVSNVIKIVLGMLDISYDRLPSETTVRNMNNERTLISQVQVATLVSKKNTTLATDETPKNGDIFMTYALTDECGESYLLGMRQMASKSAHDTLETLKETLQDITDICQIANAGDEVGHKVLCQIRNTMSDRAATEHLFNKILKTYREECLPLYVKNWEHFSQEAREKLAEMGNFFCGLHLLISIADTVSLTFKSFESNFLDGTKVGAAAEPGVHVFNNSMSGTIRLVQTVCKALSRGGDEKSGVYRYWKIYKKNSNIDKTYFLPFHGNRFNVVFMFGGRVYLLFDHITKFLSNIHGTPNGLLRAVLADIKEPLHIAGCKVLGIVNKAISAPLWRHTENNGHVLDMCEVYTALVEFLEKVTRDEKLLVDFAYGKIGCFPDHYLEKDEVYEAVLSPGPYDDTVFAMLQQTLLSLVQLFRRVVFDYLPDGKFYKIKDTQQCRQDTVSVPLHNKLPERVFGYLDFLIKKRPNATAIANEAQILYTFNKTADYVNSKTEQELNDLVETVKLERHKLKTVAKERQVKIMDYWRNKQEESAKAMQESRQRALLKKENLTNDIIETGLFQSEEQVEIYLSSETSKGKNLEVIKKQIRFRREVLGQFMDGDKGFTFTVVDKDSKKRSNKSVEELKVHLLKLINSAKNVTQSQSVKKTADNELLTVPLLVGKKVKHMWVTEDGEQWFIGNVISQVPGFPEWYNIKYTEDPKIYSLRLVDDYKDKSLSIVI